RGARRSATFGDYWRRVQAVRRPCRSPAGMAPSQDALYADIDLELSWSERDLPERERTKHVHRLHPYLGKFIPQLVEILLGRYFRAGLHARRVERRTSTSTSPVRRNSSRTGATSTSGRAALWQRHRSSSRATRSTRSSGSRSSLACVRVVARRP